MPYEVLAILHHGLNRDDIVSNIHIYRWQIYNNMFSHTMSMASMASKALRHHEFIGL